MSSDVFAIYQIDNSEKNREYRCRSYEYQIQHGFMITADNYGTGYSGTATRGMGAEAIRKKMESINPDKFKIFENGTAERAKESGTEQNYNMIDGCVNNVPQKPRRIGGRWSVLDRLHIKQAERRQKDNTPQQEQERSRKS